MKKRNITAEYIIKSNEQEIRCELSYKNCKRLRIAVTPDLQVKISAPFRAPESFILDSLREKTPWVLKSINRLKKCRVLPSPLNYVSGEKLAYLGREYTLRVIRGIKAPVMLSGDELIIGLRNPEMKCVKREVDKWYRTRAEIMFGEYLKKGLSVVSQYGVTEPFLKIRRMKSRWGSCSRSGRIVLNLRLIHLPPVCIEYIVMHELCHLKHLNHSKDYYAFLQCCMPDWKARKEILTGYRLDTGGNA